MLTCQINSYFRSRNTWVQKENYLPFLTEHWTPLHLEQYVLISLEYDWNNIAILVYTCKWLSNITLGILGIIIKKYMKIDRIAVILGVYKHQYFITMVPFPHQRIDWVSQPDQMKTEGLNKQLNKWIIKIKYCGRVWTHTMTQGNLHAYRKLRRMSNIRAGGAGTHIRLIHNLWLL